MKKLFSTLFVLTAVLLISVSCGKEKKAASTSEDDYQPVDFARHEDDEPNTYISDRARESGNWVQGVIIYSNVGLYEVNPNDQERLRWIGALPKGLDLIVEAEGSSKDSDSVVYKCLLGKDTKTTDMAKVRIDDDYSEYYVSYTCVVPHAVACVMYGDNGETDTHIGHAYTDQKINKISSSIKIPTGTIGALLIKEDTKDDWCKATFWVEPNSDYPKGALFTAKYYTEKSISQVPGNVKAAMLDTRYSKLKDPDSLIYDQAASIGSDVCNDSSFLDSLSLFGR